MICWTDISKFKLLLIQCSAISIAENKRSKYNNEKSKDSICIHEDAEQKHDANDLLSLKIQKLHFHTSQWSR